MPAKKFSRKKIVKGTLRFKHIKKGMASFIIESDDILSRKQLDLDGSVFPADFELKRYEVKDAKFRIEIPIRER